MARQNFSREDSVIMAEDFRGLPQFLQASAGIDPFK